MKILKIDQDVFELGFEFNWDLLMKSYNNKGFNAIEFEGELNLHARYIRTLPDNLTVSDSLDISSNPIKTLPYNLKVGRNLWINHTEITALPDNLTVGGSLDLQGTGIKKLPENLSVGKNLYINYSIKRDSLPKSLKVGGDVIR